MTINTNGQIQSVSIAKGDRCIWLKAHGTVFFSRPEVRLLTASGRDDKYLIKPNNLIQFSALVTMVADTVGLTATLEIDDGKHTVYVFT